MFVEELIAALRQQLLEKPSGWLICQEDRPLQAVPPGASGPHLLFFSAAERAAAFIASRRTSHGDEALTPLALDSPATLNRLANTPSLDARYAPPPCGVVLNFDPTSGASQRVISAQQMAEADAAQLAGLLGLHQLVDLEALPPPAPPTAPLRIPAAPPSPPARRAPAKRRGGLSGCVWALLVAAGLGICLMVVAAGIYLGRDQIPAVSQLFATFTPTPTDTPTPTATPTITPTPTVTDTPTITPSPTNTPRPSATPNLMQTEMEQNRQASATERAALMETASASSSLPLIWLETFAENTKSWPAGTFANDFTNETVQFLQGKYSISERPKQPFSETLCANLVSSEEFYAAVEGRLVEGLPTGDYGLVFRYVDNQNYYYFSVSGYGTYALSLFYKGKWSNLVQWQANPAIHTSASGEVNRLAVQGRGKSFALFANDQLLAELDDDKIPRGKACLGIEVYQVEEQSLFEFDNFMYFGK